MNIADRCLRRTNEKCEQRISFLLSKNTPAWAFLCNCMRAEHQFTRLLLLLHQESQILSLLHSIVRALLHYEGTFSVYPSDLHTSTNRLRHLYHTQRRKFIVLSWWKYKIYNLLIAVLYHINHPYYPKRNKFYNNKCPKSFNNFVLAPDILNKLSF